VSGQQPESSQRATREYLARVQALSLEVEGAIGAISRNNLAQLRASIAQQQLLCLEMKTAGSRLAELALGSAMAERVSEAREELQKLNRVYAALLKRSQSSVDRMVTLFKNFGQVYSKDAAAREAQHTWSCEV
jgi:hypothetical protein